MNVGITFFVIHWILYALLDVSRMIGFLFRMSAPIMSVIVLCYQTSRLSQNRTVWNGI